MTILSDWIEANRPALEIAGWRDDKSFQNFWRCAHHPIATQNFFEQRAGCEWGCHKQKLQWYHGGDHPQKKFVPYRLDGV